MKTFYSKIIFYSEIEKINLYLQEKNKNISLDEEIHKNNNDLNILLKEYLEIELWLNSQFVLYIIKIIKDSNNIESIQEIYLANLEELAITNNAKKNNQEY